MRFSASSLNEITKCGYKYYLTRIMGEKEPGKKRYNMLLGDIVGDTIQACALRLNGQGTLSDGEIAEIMATCYEQRFTQAGIDPVILEPIRRVLTEGESPEDMQLLDQLSLCISSSPYDFKVPAPLKSGKISTNKKNPPFCMKVVGSLEAVLWFFDPAQPAHAWIRDAAMVQNEKEFEFPIGEPVPVNGELVQDTVSGRFDTLLGFTDGRFIVLEYKYTNTPYTQDVVNHLNQVVTYRLVPSVTDVVLIDLTERRVIIAAPKQAEIDMVRTRYELMSKMVAGRVFMPACGTDPYTESKMLCGFKKEGGCLYAGGCGSEEEAA